MQSKSDEGGEVPTSYLIAKTERRSIMVLRTHKVSKLLHNACKVCLFALLNHDVKKSSHLLVLACALRGERNYNLYFERSVLNFRRFVKNEWGGQHYTARLFTRRMLCKNVIRKALWDTLFGRALLQAMRLSIIAMIIMGVTHASSLAG